MAIRFCKGKFIKCDIDKVSFKFVERCFKDGQETVLAYKGNEIYGYIDKNSYRKGKAQSKGVSKNFVRLDCNLFDKAKAIFDLNQTLKYLPVLHKQEVICFVFEDKTLENVRNKIVELTLFRNIKELKEKYSENDGLKIYGVNEITCILVRYLNKVKIPYVVIGDPLLLEELNLNTCNLEVLKPLEICVEGNRGLPLEELPYWGAELEWWKEDFYEIEKLYREQNILELDDYNCRIKDDLESGRPFMLARLGNTELWILKEYLEGQEGYRKGYTNFWLDYFYSTAGFFSKNNKINNQDLDGYAKLSLISIRNCDYHAYWGGEELAEGLGLIIKKFKNEKSVNFLWDDLIVPNIDEKDDNWVKSLAGKKILVISPYSNTIQRQYLKRKELFSSQQQLPDFELITYQSLETQLGNNCGFSTWIEAYHAMVGDIQKINFDIAFLCCGAYGYPLASEIKDMGKQSIELCSYLPNWFGIKIKRYVTCHKVNKYWNSQWVFPMECPPKYSNKIENNCYWE